MGLSSSSTFQLATVGLHSTSHIGRELWSTYQLATVGLDSINYYALVSQSHCRLADNLLAKWLKQFFYIDWLTFVCMQSSIFGSISQIALKHNLWKWMHFKILQSFCVDYFIITFRIQKIDQWQSVPWAWVHCKSFCSSRPLTPCSLSCHSSSPCRSVHLLLVPNMWSYHWRLMDQTFRVSQLEKTAMYVPTLNFWVGQVVWPHLSEVLSLKKTTNSRDPWSV